MIKAAETAMRAGVRSGPGSALLLTRLEDDLSVDRAALKRAGVTRLRSMDSGRAALEALGRGGFPYALDCLVVTEVLSDMDGFAFLEALQKSGLTPPPVLFICRGGHEAARALALGARAVLPRPYGISALAASLECLDRPDASFHPENMPARRAAPLRLPGCITDFSGSGVRETGAAPVPEPQKAASPEITQETPRRTAPANGPGKTDETTPLLYARRASALLRQGRENEAEELLRRALDYDSLDSEAALALARLHRAAGREADAERWLHRAAVIHLTAGLEERAAQILGKLPGGDQDPYLTEADYLLEEEDYVRAVEAFDAAARRPGAAPLHRLVSRACQFTPAPEETLRELCRAFAQSGRHQTATDLYQRLTADFGGDFAPEGGFLSSFPRLREALAVARYTYRVFRQASG